MLAPDGAVYARRWHLPHASAGGPTLTIEGSIAAEHLGLYGIPDQATGTITSGWAKTFIYPTDFWQARPPWWPDFTGNEWAPVGAPASSSGEAAPEPEPEPGFYINPTAVTVTEGSASIASFEVRLATQPSEDVTVNVRLHPSPVLLVTPAALTFTPGNWDTAQTVNVNASSYQDADVIPLVGLQVELAAVPTDGDYDTTTASVSVTVTDDDTTALVVSQNSVTVDENGTATFDVNLATQPSASVTVTLTTGNTAVATVSHAALTFTTSDWNTPQTVTINGTDDDHAADDSTIITVTATNGGYNGLTADVAVTTDDDDVEVLTVTCDAAAQTITIQWPEQGADNVYVSGVAAGVSVSWNTMQGSRLVVSTAGLASVQPWEIQYGYEQWEPQWGDLPDNWNGAWGTFWPAGDQLIVYVWPHHDSGDAFPCP